MWKQPLNEGEVAFVSFLGKDEDEAKAIVGIERASLYHITKEKCAKEMMHGPLYNLSLAQCLPIYMVHKQNISIYLSIHLNSNL